MTKAPKPLLLSAHKQQTRHVPAELTRSGSESDPEDDDDGRAVLWRWWGMTVARKQRWW